MFAFFDGDELGNILAHLKWLTTSQIQNFPLFSTVKLTHQGIKHFIGIDQVALSTNQSWYVHSTSSALDNSGFKKAFVDSSELNKIHFTLVDDGVDLPSTMTYFSHFNSNISGAIITDFYDTFNNKFYGSFLDNFKNIGIKSNSRVINDLQKLCTALAESILLFRVSV